MPFTNSLTVQVRSVICLQLNGTSLFNGALENWNTFTYEQNLAKIFFLGTHIHTHTHHTSVSFVLSFHCTLRVSYVRAAFKWVGRKLNIAVTLPLHLWSSACNSNSSLPLLSQNFLKKSHNSSNMTSAFKRKVLSII